jgi:hypothetical protein
MLGPSLNVNFAHIACYWKFFLLHYTQVLCQYRLYRPDHCLVMAAGPHSRISARTAQKTPFLSCTCGSCYADELFTVPLPSKCSLFWLNYSGFQRTCHNIYLITALCGRNVVHFIWKHGVSGGSTSNSVKLYWELYCVLISGGTLMTSPRSVSLCYEYAAEYCRFCCLVYDPVSISGCKASNFRIILNNEFGKDLEKVYCIFLGGLRKTTRNLKLWQLVLRLWIKPNTS